MTKEGIKRERGKVIFKSIQLELLPPICGCGRMYTVGYNGQDKLTYISRDIPIKKLRLCAVTNLEIDAD